MARGGGTSATLGLLSSRVRTTKDEYVTLLNSVVVSEPVTNHSAPRDHGHSLTIYSVITSRTMFPGARCTNS